MEVLFILFLFTVGIPCILSGWVCEKRNRSVAKGAVLTLMVGLFTVGWFAWVVPIGLWLALKRRKKDDPTVLY